MSGRRDRSRSPNRSRNRIKDNHDGTKIMEVPNAINPMMIQNMFPQGNMMMGGMYNMMMQNSMMAGGIMPPPGMEMIPNPGLEIMPQQTMDIQAMGTSAIPNAPANIDMSMMGGVMMDPTVMAMYQNITPNVLQEKKEIVFKHCKLIPPAPGSSEPPKRTRPPGCRTIFVGGLPDKIRESVVRDVFENYGRIQILRLSKKNFCHIRFDRESCVEAAMVISGYRIKLINRDSDMDEDDDDDEAQGTNGWLHVDYALSRDDQNEYERRQRQALRVQQQMQQLSAQQELADNSMNFQPRSPSPVRLQPFSNAAITQLAEKIKSEEAFAPTLPTLISWLERGECSKKNSNQFYSMLQATNSHIRRLFSEKMQAEEELSECKERVKNTIQKVIEQLEQVAKVFMAATHQRVWDHFTKPQRKNIETWQKMTQEFSTLKEEFNEKFFADENSEYNGFLNKQFCDNNEDLKRLKVENESLQFQLEAYKNEVDVIKADAHKEMEKFKAQFIARQALKGTFDKNPPLPSPVSKPPPPPPLPEEGEARIKPDVEPQCGEAKLIGVMSAFLQVHPQGASLDYVVSYVRALFPNVSQSAVHDVLQKFPEVFERSTSGVGANIEHKWKFIAFSA
ncbi:ecto-NOX disulfide-thiol exchanger 2 isoform X1 [Pieris napi]|uniref:ecto-NOX disulfide-thiol exchanger 2 isoform X1 n=1 Tax=Pieris napi TaxID=78633 RepID=UPI001FBB1EB7|nr:ecto-NOX disulfide-thiol exchanger 2 isoform X1 [Pieris napi]